jgi:hypothetical protein
MTVIAPNNKNQGFNLARKRHQHGSYRKNTFLARHKQTEDVHIERQLQVLNPNDINHRELFFGWPSCRPM